MQKPLFSHNTPRGIRSRLLRPRTQPKKSGTGAPPAAQHTTQSVAGRVAVGPWQGPFGADMGPTPASMPAVYSNPSGRVFASLSGAASDYNITCVETSEDEIMFLAISADDPGVEIVGDWDPLGMRGTVSRTLLFKDAFAADEAVLLPPGIYNQLAERWPYVYMTLTPAYMGLSKAVVDFVRDYMSSQAPPGVTSRRDVPQKQQGWAELQIMYEKSRALFDKVVDEARVDPTPEMVARALAASFTTMETAPEIASLAIRTCGGLSMLKEFRLEQYYRDARCGSLMLPWSAEVCLHRLGRHGIFPDDAE